MANLLPLLPELSEPELKLIADAMRDYDPERLDYSDLRVIALLDRKSVIAALRKFYRVYGTTAALRLAGKLKRKWNG